MADLLLRALRELWLALAPLGLPAAVMGGIAVSMWKHVRATRDVDVLVGAGAEAEGALIETLRRAGFRPRRAPPVMALGGFRLLQTLYEPAGSHLEIPVDLLLAESEYHFQALERRIPVPLPDLDVEVSVLACEDLVLHKLMAGRILDRADAAALLRANAATLDRPYLVEWANALGLRAELAAIWGEALPGESLPEKEA